MRSDRSGLAVVAVLATALSALAGCTASDAEARAAAEDLARAVTAGKLGQVDFAGRPGSEAQRMFAEVTRGMGESTIRARVKQVAPVEDGATTATLSYTWDLEGTDTSWKYDASIDLAEREDGWVVDWAQGAIAPGLKPGERLVTERVVATRGDIIGGDGTPLVTERPVVRFGIDKTQVEPPAQERSARDLARLLGIDAAGYAEEVAAAGDRAFVEAIVLRRADIAPSVARAYPKITGAAGLPDEIPLAPSSEFARPVLGTVGPATAELIAESEGRLRPDDQTGLSGLQARYDETLSGTPGIVVSAASTTTDAVRELFRDEAVDGADLGITLDADLQLVADEALAQVGPASAIVAIRPSTGELLAVSSGPGGGGLSTATVGQYAPGSTFKVVSTLALLRAGLRPGTTVSCPETIDVEGRSFKNYDDYPASQNGQITLRDALAHSCNTAFIGQRDKADQQSLHDAAASLGLGVDRDLGFPAFLGSVPTEASGTGHAASMIGQGEVLASPLAMATVAASVVDGDTVVPRLINDQTDDGATENGSVEPLAPGRADALRAMMQGVVTEGSGDFLASLSPPAVLAKTGTAEFGTEEPLQTHAWMIGAQGDLAVAVFVEVGESGSQTAGPILEAFLRSAR